jgi:hypothetical protein
LRVTCADNIVTRWGWRGCLARFIRAVGASTGIGQFMARTVDGPVKLD